MHALKIDQSFVRGIGCNSANTALVAAIIAMAHSLHLKVLAEGVETMQQIEFLKAHGCLAAQGFYYSKAVAAETLTDLLQAQHRSDADFVWPRKEAALRERRKKRQAPAEDT